MTEQNLQEQFSALQQEFLRFTKETDFLPDELEEDRLFFQAPVIKDLIAFGAEHNEFLEQIVDTFAGIGSMDIYRGCLTGYLIGLYGKAISSPNRQTLPWRLFFNRSSDYVKITWNWSAGGWEFPPKNWPRMRIFRSAFTNFRRCPYWNRLLNP